MNKVNSNNLTSLVRLFLYCRPFYVSTTTSSPRDVVVVIEMSSSMRGDILFEAKHAVLTVMETLDVEDKVSLPILSTFEKAIIRGPKSQACGFQA